MANLIGRARSWKSANNFSLYAHASGRWARKVAGKLHFFGPITEDIADSAQFALNAYLDQKDDIAAGRKPRDKGDGKGLTIRELCNAFLKAKDEALQAGEISRRTRADYGKMRKAPNAEPTGPEGTCDRIVKQFGKERAVSDLRPEDFGEFRAVLAKTRGLVALGNEIQRVRSVFKFALDAELIESPVRYGKSFDKPTRKALRIKRAEQGEKMFSSEELRALLDKATPAMKAMMLLALNCGFGNSDCATLPLQALDLETGWVNFPRPKTGVKRRAPLWPETIEALKAVLAKRKAPRDPAYSKLVFVTYKFGTFNRDLGGGAVAKEFARLCKAAGLSKEGRGFYTLRHVHRTIADESRDQPACDALMGHAVDDMASKYRERIGDDRLQAVVDHVHAWLFPDDEQKQDTGDVVPAIKAAPKPRRTAQSKPASVRADAMPFRVVG